MTKEADRRATLISSANRKPLRICLIGWGAIGQRVAELLTQRSSLPIDIVALGVRRTPEAGECPANVEIITKPEELADLDVDLVVEAAGRDALAQWGIPALRHTKALAVASASAFCDTALLDSLVAVATAAGSQILVPPGALAGIDGLSAASLLDIEEVVHRIVKPPAAWRGTLAETLVSLDTLREPTTFFSGTARDAASRFPQNANVAAISALAGIGFDRTRVELIVDPDATRNSHVLIARGAFGKLDVTVENRPLARNPKTSELAALALVRTIENRVRPLVF